MGRKIWKFFRRPNRQDNNFDSKECKFEMIVPIHKVGVIIGKGGKTIKKLQKLSKAKLTFVNANVGFTLFTNQNCVLILLVDL